MPQIKSRRHVWMRRVPARGQRAAEGRIIELELLLLSFLLHGPLRRMPQACVLQKVRSKRPGTCVGPLGRPLTAHPSPWSHAQSACAACRCYVGPVAGAAVLAVTQAALRAPSCMLAACRHSSCRPCPWGTFSSSNCCSSSTFTTIPLHLLTGGAVVMAGSSTTSSATGVLEAPGLCPPA